MTRRVLPRRRPRLAMIAALALTVAVGGCGGNGAGTDGDTGARAEGGAAPSRLRVLAPASLTEAFTTLSDAFEAEHGVEVSLSFGGSPSLVTQLGAGAPADVLATADQESMGRAVSAGDARSPALFARNRLTVVVERGNPQQLRDIGDLARPELVVVACAPEVPCGRLARRVFEAAGISVTPRSQEENVKAVLAKVTLGEADAGLVYETDAATADGLDRLDLLPQDPTLTTPYAIAITTDAEEVDLARRWVDFVRSPAGQQVLGDHGFLPA